MEAGVLKEGRGFAQAAQTSHAKTHASSGAVSVMYSLSVTADTVENGSYDTEFHF